METTTRKSIAVSELGRLDEEINPLKAVFDQMTDHVVITDENANIIYANKAVERHTGFSQLEIMGRNPGDFWGGKMPRSFYEKMWFRIKIEKEPFVSEVLNTRKDGSEYWQELRISPILNKNGDVQFFIGIEPNITKLKDKEEERQKFIFAFEKRTQNSLSAMRQTLDWLNLNGKLTQKQQEHLKAVYKNQQNLAQLISDFIKKQDF